MSCDVHIADDNVAFARTLERMMWREGVEPAGIAHSGRELIATLAPTGRPAILYIDMDMPEMDGLDVLHALLDLPRPMRLRFMTGASYTEALAANMTANARGLSVGRILYKPLSRARLREALEADFLALGLAWPVGPPEIGNDDDAP
jgi:CheY-like chemotaxis protein